LRVEDVLYAVSKAGLKLEAGETAQVLKAYPAEKLTPQLAAAIKEHKAAIIRILGEDEEMRRTGVIKPKDRSSSWPANTSDSTEREARRDP
jgi:hypothetical protein